MFGWRPRGRRLDRLEQLHDGMSVQAISVRGLTRKGLRQATIKIAYEGTLGRIFIKYSDGKMDFLGYTDLDPRYNYLGDYLIYVSNKFIRRPTMANKLLAALKLNKEQRKLSKVGVYDENGNLTTDGQELLLNFLAKKHEAELVEMTKDLIKEKKDCKEDK